MVLRRPDGSTASPTLAVPHPKDKRQPVVVPDQVVTASKLDGGIGLLRVSMFPGVLGMDVARDMSRAVDELACDRLIVDLRGNTGGGIGCLRLMSLMCADRRGVGYSLGRDAAKAGRTKEQLPAFDRIPSSKWGVLPLIVKFARGGRSVAVFTEALGARRHHGRVVLLVNEHSASAAEMVAAFASEYGLATLVGTQDAGPPRRDQRVQGGPRLPRGASGGGVPTRGRGRTSKGAALFQMSTSLSKRRRYGRGRTLSCEGPALVATGC